MKIIESVFVLHKTISGTIYGNVKEYEPRGSFLVDVEIPQGFNLERDPESQKTPPTFTVVITGDVVFKNNRFLLVPAEIRMATAEERHAWRYFLL